MQWMIDLAMSLLIIAILPTIYESYKNRRELAKRSFVFFVTTLVGNSLAITWGLLNGQYMIAFLNLMYAVWSALTIAWMIKYRG